MPKEILIEWEQVLEAAAYLQPRWHDWQIVRAACIDCATIIFDRIVGLYESSGV